MRKRNLLLVVVACLATLTLTVGTATASTNPTDTPSPGCPTGPGDTLAQCIANFTQGLESNILARVCPAIENLPPLLPGPPATITDLHAGVFNNFVPLGLKPAVKQAYDITLNDVGGNSVKLANSIKAGSLTGDLFMSADASVNQTLMGAANGNWVDWFTVFARNQVVLAYDPHSKFATDFQTKPWYQVLQEPGIKLGRYDPNLDPLGYYTLFVAELAEKYYGLPGFKQQILGADNNPNQLITANFPDGVSDAAFYYRSDASFDKTPFVTLADQINLSNPAFVSQYAQASYTTNIGQTFHGAPIQQSIAPLRGGNTRAADEVIHLLDSPQGAGLISQFGFLPSPILAGGNINHIPLPLRCQVQGTYHTP
jgi:molybdate/tungstate transport system substrate-binding protein